MSQLRDVQPMADQAFDALKAALQQGVLREGQFLSMPQLIEIIEFPIASVREAVKLASSEGLLVTLPKRGVQVMEARPDIIRECLDFRMVLDQEGARRRIASGDFSGLEMLRIQHQDMLDSALNAGAGDSPLMVIELEVSLHDYLAAGLGNSHLEKDYAANRLRIAVIQNTRPFLQARIVTAMEEHLAIMGAMEARDSEAAAAAIRYHYDQTLQWWGVAPDQAASNRPASST